MSRRIRVDPLAESELQGAAEWYEAQDEGLGHTLLAEVDACLTRIAAGDHGAPYPLRESGVRRLPVDRFPLWVIFLEERTQAVIVAFAHERKRPGYWLGRVTTS